MSLTRKDREEIKELIREVIGEDRPKTIDSEDSAIGTYAEMFDLWQDNSIDTDFGNISSVKLAPEDFVLKADFRLSDGIILKKGKRYFTYDEAMALEKELLEPNGWRLPTTQEFMLLYAAYGLDENGQDDPKALREALKFEPQGYIDSDDMDEYNEAPENFENNDGTVIGRTTGGRWWSRNASSATYANFLGTPLHSGTGYVTAQGRHCRGGGLSVRCVVR